MDNRTGGAASTSSEYIAFASVFSFIILANLVGNSLVVLVILRDRASQTAMNYLLINLAFADMTVAIFMAIKFVIVPMFRHPDGLTGRLLCKFITGGATAWTGAVASIYNLVAIALECYYAIFQPYKRRGKQLTCQILGKTFFVIWMTAVVWGLPLYLSVTYVDDLMTCAEQWPSPILPKLYSFGWIVVGGVVPTTIMTILYFKVVHLLWFRQDLHLNPSQLALLHSRRRVTTMVIGVSGIYVMCWTPTLLIYFLANVLPSEDMYSVVHKISILLATINSSVNPVIYSLRSSRFRQNLYHAVRCTRKHKAMKFFQTSPTILYTKR